jgi:hypothetical protein
MLERYFSIINNIYVYIEYNFVILYSFLGILKVKNNDFISLFIKKNIIFSIIMNPSIVFFIRNVFLLTSYGYYKKFKLVGIGYRQFYSNNLIVYKLRYSHLIHNILPFNILTFKKHKRRKFFTLFSLNKNELNKIIHI